MFAPKVAKPQAEQAATHHQTHEARPSSRVVNKHPYDRNSSDSDQASLNVSAIRPGMAFDLSFGRIPLFPPGAELLRPSMMPVAPAVVGDVVNSSGRAIDPSMIDRLGPPLRPWLQRARPSTVPFRLGETRVGQPTDEQEISADRFARLSEEASTSIREPLHPAERRRLEAVRIHTDTQAARSARAVGASAYTLGEHIAFSPPAYDWASQSGRRLIAHELFHAVSGMTEPGTPVLRRQKASPQVSGLGDVEEYMADDDWARAAWALGNKSNDKIELAIRKMTPGQRERVIEGARMSEPAQWVDNIVSIMWPIDRRSALIGSIRWARWKHEWSRAGQWFTGMAAEDARRVAHDLDFSWEDLAEVAGENNYLNEMFFGGTWLLTNPWRHERVSARNAPQLAVSALKSYPPVADYADKKFHGGLLPSTSIVPKQSWASVVAEHHRGRTDPHTGRQVTEADVTAASQQSGGFTDPNNQTIYLPEDATPGDLIHEAVHYVALPAVSERLGTDVNEGMTEFFARRIAASSSNHPPHSYQDQYVAVSALVKLVGEQVVAAALFEGKILALELAVDEKIPGAFQRWKDLMIEGKASEAAHVLDH